MRAFVLMRLPWLIMIKMVLTQSDKLITMREGTQTIALYSTSIGSLTDICGLTCEILKELSCGTTTLQLSYGFTIPGLLMQKMLSFILCMGMVSYLKLSVVVLKLRVLYMMEKLLVKLLLFLLLLQLSRLCHPT